jgi:hypothetical protein
VAREASRVGGLAEFSCPQATAAAARRTIPMRVALSMAARCTRRLSGRLRTAFDPLKQVMRIT